MALIRKGAKKGKSFGKRIARAVSPTYRLYDNWRTRRRQRRMRRRENRYQGERQRRSR